jgi:hypothetical protein
MVELTRSLRNARPLEATLSTPLPASEYSATITPVLAAVKGFFRSIDLFPPAGTARLNESAKSAAPVFPVLGQSALTNPVVKFRGRPSNLPATDAGPFARAVRSILPEEA